MARLNSLAFLLPFPAVHAAIMLALFATFFGVRRASRQHFGTSLATILGFGALGLAVLFCRAAYMRWLSAHDPFGVNAAYFVYSVLALAYLFVSYTLISGAGRLLGKYGAIAAALLAIAPLLFAIHWVFTACGTPNWDGSEGCGNVMGFILMFNFGFGVGPVTVLACAGQAWLVCRWLRSAETRAKYPDKA
jgi:hypothetical protein